MTEPTTQPGGRSRLQAVAALVVTTILLIVVAIEM